MYIHGDSFFSITWPPPCIQTTSHLLQGLPFPPHSPTPPANTPAAPHLAATNTSTASGPSDDKSQSPSKVLVCHFVYFLANHRPRTSLAVVLRSLAYTVLQSIQLVIRHLWSRFWRHSSNWLIRVLFLITILSIGAQGHAARVSSGMMMIH